MEFKKTNMAIAASDVDAVKAVKMVFPIIEEKMKRIDMCWFDHAWLNASWEEGDTAGTLFFETNAKFSFFENLLMLIINELYKETASLKYKYTFTPEPTAQGFALHVNIAPNLNESYVYDVNVKKANAENLVLLKNKLSVIPGVFGCKVQGEGLAFHFNGQAFTISRGKGMDLSSATDPTESSPRKIKVEL